MFYISKDNLFRSSHSTDTTDTSSENGVEEVEPQKEIADEKHFAGHCPSRWKNFFNFSSVSLASKKEGEIAPHWHVSDFSRSFFDKKSRTEINKLKIMIEANNQSHSPSISILAAILKRIEKLKPKRNTVRARLGSFFQYGQYGDKYTSFDDLLQKQKLELKEMSYATFKAFLEPSHNLPKEEMGKAIDIISSEITSLTNSKENNFLNADIDQKINELAQIRIELQLHLLGAPTVIENKKGSAQSIGIESGSTQGGVTIGLKVVAAGEVDRPVVFKEASQATIQFDGLENYGIPKISQSGANLAGRNVAFYRYASLLGMGSSVPKTEIATYNGRYGTIQEEAEGKKLSITVKEEDKNEGRKKNYIEELVDNIKISEKGLLDFDTLQSSMERFKLDTSISAQKHPPCILENGKAIGIKRLETLIKEGKILLMKDVVQSVETLDFSEPTLQRELSNIEVLDFLFGSADRHPDDFFFKTKTSTDSTSTKSIQLIDNDLGFGERSDNIQDVIDQRISKTIFPQRIDRTMAETVGSLTPETIREEMKGLGLTETSFQAAAVRLNFLKDRLVDPKKNTDPPVDSNLSPQVRITDEWDKSTHDSYMNNKDGFKIRSYVALLTQKHDDDQDKLIKAQAEALAKQ